MTQYPVENKLKKIYNGSSFTDVTFIVGKTEERFKAHKLLLSLNSSYFESLFYPKEWRSESRQKVQEIRFSNVQPEVFQSILDYNYTNTLNIDPKWIYQLISASLILEIPDLNVACLEQLTLPTLAKDCAENNSQSSETIITPSPLAVVIKNEKFLKGLRLWLSGNSKYDLDEYDLFLLLKK